MLLVTLYTCMLVLLFRYGHTTFPKQKKKRKEEFEDTKGVIKIRMSKNR